MYLGMANNVEAPSDLEGLSYEYGIDISLADVGIGARYSFSDSPLPWEPWSWAIGYAPGAKIGFTASYAEAHLEWELTP